MLPHFLTVLDFLGVGGDKGPYTKKNCRSIQVKFFDRLCRRQSGQPELLNYPCLSRTKLLAWKTRKEPSNKNLSSKFSTKSNMGEIRLQESLKKKKKPSWKRRMIRRKSWQRSTPSSNLFSRLLVKVSACYKLCVRTLLLEWLSKKDRCLFSQLCFCIILINSMSLIVITCLW